MQFALLACKRNFLGTCGARLRCIAVAGENKAILIHRQLEEQNQLLGGLEEGQPADAIPMRIAEPQNEMDGLEKSDLKKYGRILGAGVLLCAGVCIQR